MKKIVIVLIVLALAGFSHAIEVTQPDTTSPDAQIVQLNQSLRQLEIRVGQTLTKADFELMMLASQAQEEQLSQSSTFSNTALLIGVVILNDILLISAFIISKTLGWFS